MSARKPKRLCVFYVRQDDWVGKPIDWIVCKACQRRICRGYIFDAVIHDAKVERESGAGKKGRGR